LVDKPLQYLKLFLTYVRKFSICIKLWYGFCT